MLKSRGYDSGRVEQIACRCARDHRLSGRTGTMAVTRRDKNIFMARYHRVDGD